MAGLWLRASPRRSRSAPLAAAQSLCQLMPDRRSTEQVPPAEPRSWAELCGSQALRLSADRCRVNGDLARQWASTWAFVRACRMRPLAELDERGGASGQAGTGRPCHDGVAGLGGVGDEAGGDEPAFVADVDGPSLDEDGVPQSPGDEAPRPPPRSCTASAPRPGGRVGARVHGAVRGP